MSIKCIVIGDQLAGKTEFIKMYQANKYPVVIDGNATKLELIDESGQEEYDKIRPLLYTQAEIFIICFSVIIPSTQESVTNKWVKEVQKYAPNVPYILVGTQIENRNNQSKKDCSFKQGQALAKKIKASKYFECSVKNDEGFKDIFETAINEGATAYEEKPKKKGCVIL